MASSWHRVGRRAATARERVDRIGRELIEDLHVPGSAFSEANANIDGSGAVDRRSRSTSHRSEAEDRRGSGSKSQLHRPPYGGRLILFEQRPLGVALWCCGPAPVGAGVEPRPLPAPCVPPASFQLIERRQTGQPTRLEDHGGPLTDGIAPESGGKKNAPRRSHAGVGAAIRGPAEDRGGNRTITGEGAWERLGSRLETGRRPGHSRGATPGDSRLDRRLAASRRWTARSVPCTLPTWSCTVSAAIGYSSRSLL